MSNIYFTYQMKSTLLGTDSTAQDRKILSFSPWGTQIQLCRKIVTIKHTVTNYKNSTKEKQHPKRKNIRENQALDWEK